MAVLSSGLADIQAWGQGAPRGVLPKWWRWVMLLILVYSSTISVLTGQARSARTRPALSALRRRNARSPPVTARPCDVRPLA